jgi:hypothetical protein
MTENQDTTVNFSMHLRWLTSHWRQAKEELMNVSFGFLHKLPYFD